MKYGYISLISGKIKIVLHVMRLFLHVNRNYFFFILLMYIAYILFQLILIFIYPKYDIFDPFNQI